MTIIHVRASSKRRKPNAVQRKLQEDWEKLMQKHSKPLEKGSKSPVPLPKESLMKLENPPGREQVKRLKSRVTPGGEAVVKETQKYSGSNILGIAQMAKSNAVPVFSQQEAIEVARMRRG